jgi:S-adenosylmethionine hydrolase
MAIITLTSDWGTKDHYTGAVKGSILRRFPEARIVDISHHIPPFDLNQAAFIIRNFYPDFPVGTVHILAINTEAAISSPHTIVEYHGHFFIGADNGIFSLICDEPPERIIEIDVMQDSDYFTFSARDVFVKVACHIAQGKPLEELGRIRKTLAERMSFKPVIQGDMIKGKVIYVDNYENAFTNITESLFKSFVKNRKFSITFRSSAYRIESISRAYQDVAEGEMLALFSASGYLQIAMNRGPAAKLLGLGMDQAVIVELL